MKLKDKVQMMHPNTGLEVKRHCLACGGTVFSYRRTRVWSWATCRSCGHVCTERSLGWTLSWIGKNKKDPAKLRRDAVKGILTITGIDVSEYMEKPYED